MAALPSPVNWNCPLPANVLDMGNSGTAARLLCGILASHPIFSVLTGDASLCGRPMRRVIDPLTATGARFGSRAGAGVMCPAGYHTVVTGAAWRSSRPRGRPPRGV